MSYWFVDRMLPSLISSVLFAGILWVSHRRLSRHVTDVTDKQTKELERDR